MLLDKKDAETIKVNYVKLNKVENELREIEKFLTVGYSMHLKGDKLRKYFSYSLSKLIDTVTLSCKGNFEDKNLQNWLTVNFSFSKKVRKFDLPGKGRILSHSERVSCYKDLLSKKVKEFYKYDIDDLDELIRLFEEG